MKSIIIYSTPTCVYCNMAKSFFKAHNVPFTEYDVATDLSRRKEMIEKMDGLKTGVNYLPPGRPKKKRT